MITQTPRLIIRKLMIHDLQDLFALLSDQDVMHYSLKGPHTLEMTQQFLSNMLEIYQKVGYGIYAVILKSSDTFIGMCGFYLQEVDGQSEVELGFRFAKPYWHQGYATEAALACRDYAIKHLRLKKLISIIAPTNIASIKVAEKVGFHLEHNTVFHDIDVLLYRYEAPSR